MDAQAIFDNFRRNVTAHYFDMTGRVGRPEYWYFVLAYVVIGLGVSILQAMTFLPLLAIYNLALLLPCAGLTARRLQDTGRDGRLVWVFIFVVAVSQFIAFIIMLNAFLLGFGLFLIFFGTIASIVNLMALIVCVVAIWFCCQPGNPGPNMYGPVPPLFDPATKPA